MLSAAGVLLFFFFSCSGEDLVPVTVKSASEDASSHEEAIFSYCLRDEFHVETEDMFPHLPV